VTRKTTQLRREGGFAADVSIELHEGHGEWGPTLRLPDLQKLDRVRKALRAGDLVGAARDAQVFRLVPHTQLAGPPVAAGFNESEQSGLKS
jgi:hypothetical protein